MAPAKIDSGVVGFDFGTTNTLVSVVRSRGPVNLFGKDQLPIPSVVCYEGNRKIIGREAKERLAGAGLGVHGNVIRSPKLFLGRDSVFVDGVELSPVDVVSDFIRFVRQEASETARRTRRLDLEIDRAVMTIPINMDGRRRAALRDACRMSGLSILQFVHEPFAALYGYLRSAADANALRRRLDRQLILVVDWGGGTLDVTLCRLIGNALVQISNDGTDEVGGDQFDDCLVNEVVARAHRDRPGLPSEALPSSAARLLEKCERAKIELSGRPKVEVFVSQYFRADSGREELSVSLEKKDLEVATKPLVDGGIARVRQVVERSGFSTQQIGMCLAVGGMVSMPVITERLHEMFGPARVQIPSNSATLIAEGAAWVANDQARLTLAKRVELLLARNSHMGLIDAGVKLPREGEILKRHFDIYCVDPTDGAAKFELQSPRSPGNQVARNDERVALDNLVIEVDARARPFEERLRLELEIDDNLILNVGARSLEKADVKSVKLHELEFGLALPDEGSHSSTHRGDTRGPQESKPKQSGAVTMRSNISEHEDLTMVPGEVLYRLQRLQQAGRLDDFLDGSRAHQSARRGARPEPSPALRGAGLETGEDGGRGAGLTSTTDRYGRRGGHAVSLVCARARAI